ncbi:type II toxin-antitoxin system HicB family antitoxin [Nostoc sp.]|uniref:type II toxin-antitoxin system HicB family antitoxin n=1 Tax=Nostoc sp. TaxID=1180 RepID=UPI002FFB9D91
MLITYTAKYTKTNSGYMGQLIEWQEVITEGETIEKCRAMLQDATKEMVLAYRQQDKEIPTGDRCYPVVNDRVVKATATTVTDITLP